MCEIKNKELLNGIMARHSCRVFTEQEIDHEKLRSVLEYAVHSPSAKNGQPWEVTVVTGPKLAQLKDRMEKAFADGERSPMKAWHPYDKTAQRARALGLSMAPGIVKQMWLPNSFIGRCIRFFEAPAVVVVCMSDHSFTPWDGMDIGAFMQTLCLSAEAHGLGTCILGYPLIVEPTLRAELNVPEDQKIMITVALGYPKEGAPMAEFHSGREKLEENVRFLSE